MWLRAWVVLLLPLACTAQNVFIRDQADLVSFYATYTTSGPIAGTAITFDGAGSHCSAKNITDVLTYVGYVDGLLTIRDQEYSVLGGDLSLLADPRFNGSLELELHKNRGLTSLAGLEGKHIQTNMYIRDNPEFASWGGFGAAQTTLERIEILGNPAMRNFTGLAFTEFNGDIVVTAGTDTTTGLESFYGWEGVTGNVSVDLTDTPYLQDLSGLADLSVYSLRIKTADALTNFGSFHLEGAAGPPSSAWLYLRDLPAATGSMTLTGSDVDVVYIYNAPGVEVVDVAIDSLREGASVALQLLDTAAVTMNGTHFAGPTLGLLLFDGIANLSFAGASGNVSTIYEGVSFLDIAFTTTFAGLEGVFHPGGVGISPVYSAPGGLNYADANIGANEMTIVDVTDCARLVDLNGLGHLAGVLSASLKIVNNDALRDVSALRRGITGLAGQSTPTAMKYGDITIAYNPVLESIAMDDIEFCKDLVITQNVALRNISLPSMANVNGALFLLANVALRCESRDTLIAQPTVWGQVYVASNCVGTSFLPCASPTIPPSLSTHSGFPATCNATLSPTSTTQSELSALLDSGTGLYAPMTVCLEAGTYTGFTSGCRFRTCGGGAVWLKGSGMDTTVIDLGGRGRAVNIGREALGRVSGLTIRDGAPPKDAFAGAAFVNDGALEATNVKFSNILDTAIFIESSNAEFTCDGCVFEHNYQTASTGPNVFSAAIHAYQAASVAVVRSVFFNCSGGEGPAVHATYVVSLFLESCTFTNNTGRTGNGGAVYVSAGGGLEAVCCNFSGNSAAQHGGAVYKTGLVGAVSLSSCLLSLNWAGADGGGVAVNQPRQFVVANSSFVRNSADRHAALLVNQASSVLLEGLLMKGNTGNDYGGALTVQSYRFLTVTDWFARGCVFEDNESVDIWGAVRLSDLDTGGITFHFVNCSVVGNSALGDGVFSVFHAWVVLLRSHFEDNRAASGGAIHTGSSTASSPVLVNVTDTIFVNCEGDDGGAIYMEALTHVTVRETLFTNCGASAGEGGAVWVGDTESRLSVYSSVFTGNSALTFGGVVSTSQTGYFVVENSTFVDSTASDGSVFYAAGEVNVSTSAFAENIAFNVGIIYSTGAVFVGDSKFTDNYAYHGGAVFLPDDATVIFTGCSFFDNYAYSNGGVLSAAFQTTVTVLHCTFARNGAQYNGGDLYVLNSEFPMTVVNASFTGSSARDKGGAMRIFHTTLRITDSSFVGTTCDEGAALHVRTYPATVTGCTFYDCTAHVTGVVDGITTRLRILDSVVADSTGVGVYSTWGLYAENMEFRNLATAEDGGGVHAQPYSTRLVEIYNSRFVNTTSGGRGGALYLSDNLEPNPILPTVSGCTFSDSTAASGGAVYADVHLYMSDCTVSRTYAQTGAGVMLASPGNTLADVSFSDCTAAAVGGSVFVFFTASLDATRISVTASSPDCLFSLLADSVVIEDSVLEASADDGYAVDVTGAALLAINDSVITAGPLSSCIRVAGTASVVVTGSLVSKDTSSEATHALTCTDTTVDIADSVLCTSGGSTSVYPVNCGSLCSVGGSAGYMCSDEFAVNECAASCESRGLCVPDEPFTTAPNYGCHECSGACWSGADNCDPSSTACMDDGSGGFYCDCLPGYTNNTGTSCGDIDECALGTHDCIAPAVCLNNDGSFTCGCPSGYFTILLSDGTVLCINEDECTSTPGICGINGECTDTTGSFTCECAAGFYEVFGYVGCRRCPPGHYIDGDGSNQYDCLRCPVDTYSNDTDAGSCTDCPLFSSTEGLDAALDCVCDAGFSYDEGFGLCLANCSVGEQRTADYACVPCPLGTYAVKAGVCGTCPLHTTTTVTGARNCECSDGYVDAASSSSGADGSGCAKVCGPGWFVEPITSTCLQCYEDTYKNTTSTAQTCSPCPLVGMSSLRGSDSLADCVCSGGLAPNYALGKCDLFCYPGTSRPVPYTECFACGSGFYSDSVNQEDCTACPSRTTSPPQSDTISDCGCEVGAYDPQGRAGVACKKCPYGASCSGGANQPISRPGFYPAGDGSFVECVPFEACNADGECSEGYEGDRCAACMTGYYRVRGECRSCGPITTFSLVVGVVLLVCFCVALFAYNYNDAGVVAFPSLIIGLNALQIVAEYGRLSAAWPPVIKSIFDVLALVSFSIEFIAPECVVGGDNAFVLRFVLTMLIPVAVAGLYGLCYAVFSLVAALPAARITGEVASNVRRSVLQCGMQLLLIFYLPVSAAVFGFFDCVDSGVLDADGNATVRVVRSSPDVVCRGPVWNRALPFAAFALIAYTLAAPTVFAGILLRAEYLLGDDFFVKFGYLVNRYRPELFYFEIAILVRKLGLVFFVTFVTGSAYIRAGAAMAWLLFNFVSHSIVEPYGVPAHNKLESACLLLVCMLLQEGVMLQDGTLSEAGKDTIMVFTLLVLVVAIAAGVVYDVRSRDSTKRESRRQSSSSSAFVKGLSPVVFDDIANIDGGGGTGGLSALQTPVLELSSLDADRHELLPLGDDNGTGDAPGYTANAVWLGVDPNAGANVYSIAATSCDHDHPLATVQLATVVPPPPPSAGSAVSDAVADLTSLSCGPVPSELETHVPPPPPSTGSSPAGAPTPPMFVPSVSCE